MESIKAEVLSSEDVGMLEDMFRYHAVEPDQVERYVAVRAAGRAMATAILLNCPKSADRSAAVRKIREAVMTANASIALKGRA